MDHNLDDSLNLDSAMGVDFEPPGDAVDGQADISLDAVTHEANMPMEFESIEEQPMLMDAENEQIIGYSDDQFNLQEYGVHQDEHTGANTTVVSSEQPMSQSDSMLDIHFDPQAFTTAPIKVEPQVQQPKIIAVKAAMPRPPARKDTIVVSGMPRQVAIAPKPQPAPAPRALRPLTLAAPRAPALVKKVSLAAVPGAAQGKTVLAQIGKQLVMVPGTNQKIKLVAAPSGVSNIQYIRANQNDQAQLIATKSMPGTKPMLTKFIIQGQTSDASNQPAVITRLVQAAPQARFVTMTQKTVPISMPNKVLVTSPSKQTVRITKKPHVVEIKSPTTKFIPTTQTGGPKKVVITAAPTQNVILKTTAPPKNPQIGKDGNITFQGQRTQLHQINVPGKGIQYIRLVTSGAPRRPPPAAPKAVVLTDAKGNVLQMATEKVQSSQPPPLVISGTTSTINKLTARPQQRLVRIAPVGSKPALAATQSTARPLQSLLAPLSPAPVSTPDKQYTPDEDVVDSKAALHELLGVSLDQGANVDQRPQVEVELERHQSDEESRSNSPEAAEEPSNKESEPLIVIPNYLKPQEILPDDYASRDDANKRFTNFDAQAFNSYQRPPTPQPSESDLVSTELGMRPRKACNCTKSQCLKLYCDCFANGEFCHRCNCNNCHNNLDNEELRQKAIRGCLDRNPNAFRPKIGKAKSGGPEIVRRHNKGCNCKRSGCLKNYCECYEAKIACMAMCKCVGCRNVIFAQMPAQADCTAKIACTAMCKCVGCRNVEESVSRRRDRARDVFRPQALPHINFMTTEVIEAVCQCLIAAAAEPGACAVAPDPVRDVIDEFSRCLQDIINAAHHSAPMLDESRA